MTRIAFLKRADRVRHRKLRDERRIVRALADVRQDENKQTETTPSFGLLSRRTRHAFDIDAVHSDELAPAMQTSIEAFVWYRDLQNEAPFDERLDPGWHFLTAAGWLKFSRVQADMLEARMASTNSRLIKVPSGKNIAQAAWVDLDRMLLLDPDVPEFASTERVLPVALPVLRVAAPQSLIHWRYTLAVDSHGNDWYEFDESDCELLSLAMHSNRPCTVLYGSARAVVVDFRTMQWSDCLWACGFDDDDSAFEGLVSRDESASKPESPYGDIDATVNPDVGNQVHHSSSRVFQSQIEQLVAMGFDWNRARSALQRSRSMEQATSILLAQSADP